MNSNTEAEQCLCEIFKAQIDNIQVDFHGTSEKGDGYVGDILFATVKGVQNGGPREFHVVLKCSKRNDELREKFPVRNVFLNEIAIYETVFPAFRHFENDKGVADQFQSIPKYYGKFVSNNYEIIVLENLKKSGYELWNRKLPIPREYLRKVLEEYARFHAISVAMNDQKPETFKEICGTLSEVFEIFNDVIDVNKMFTTNIHEICDLLHGKVDDAILEVWRNFSKKIPYCVKLTNNISGLKSIIHSDCWCNNYMFRKNDSLDAVIIDWQLARISSPLVDVGFFIFNAISKEDIASTNDLLEEYYETFISRVKQLGTALEYSKEDFFNDFRKYCLFGLLETNFTIRMCLSESEEAHDVLDTVKSSDSNNFSNKIRNEEALKTRMAYIIEYAVKEGLLTND